MSEREKRQNGYFTGGEIGGVRFYHLSMDRLEHLMIAAGAGLENREMLLCTLLVYSMSNPAAAGSWTVETLRDAARKKFGEFPALAALEFQNKVEGDFAAIQATETVPENAPPGGSDEAAGK